MNKINFKSVYIFVCVYAYVCIYTFSILKAYLIDTFSAKKNLQNKCGLMMSKQNTSSPVLHVITPMKGSQVSEEYIMWPCCSRRTLPHFLRFVLQGPVNPTQRNSSNSPL